MNKYKDVLLRRLFDMICIGGIAFLLSNGLNILSIGFSSIIVFIYVIIGTEIEEEK